MKNELKELQDGLNLSMDEVVQTVRTLYPKFDKPLLSKCKATEKYGIILAQDAMDRLYDRFLPKEEPQKPDAPSKQKTRHGQHRLNCRISCRLPDTDYQRLQELIRADGYSTMPDWLTGVVSNYLNEISLRGDEHEEQ